MQTNRRKWLAFWLGLFIFSSCDYSQEEMTRRGFAFGLNEKSAGQETVYFSVSGRNYNDLKIDIYNTETGRETKPEFFINDEKLKREAREAGFEKMLVETLDKRRYTIDLNAPDAPLKIEERE